MVPGEITTQLSNDQNLQVVTISRTRTLEQKSRGELNPDSLDDSDAVTLENSFFPDRPDVYTFKDNCGCDQQRFDVTKPWCLYNVMLVEWNDGVAYCLGVGKVYIDAWAQSRPKKKIIILG